MMYFYSSPEPGALILLSPAMVGTIRLVERASGSIFEPLIGWWSDRARTRWGRRLPWIVIGMPFLCASFTMIWFPPRATATDDFSVIIHCCVALMVFYVSYT